MECDNRKTGAEKVESPASLPEDAFTGGDQSSELSSDASDSRDICPEEEEEIAGKCSAWPMHERCAPKAYLERRFLGAPGSLIASGRLASPHNIFTHRSRQRSLRNVDSSLFPTILAVLSLASTFTSISVVSWFQQKFLQAQQLFLPPLGCLAAHNRSHVAHKLSLLRREVSRDREFCDGECETSSLRPQVLGCLADGSR